MKKRTNPKGPRRTAREAILDAAVVALAESPDVPMAVIAESAGVGRATLYRHFPSRDDLIKELSLQAIRLTDEAVAPVFQNYTDAEQPCWVCSKPCYLSGTNIISWPGRPKHRRTKKSLSRPNASSTSSWWVARKCLAG